MAIHNVSNANELTAAIDSAQAGDTIELASGFYGDLRILNTNYSSDVTITSADAGDPATFSSIFLFDSSNITFDSLNVEFEADEDTREWHSAFRADYSSDITLQNSVVTGDEAVGGISPDSPETALDGTGVEGYAIGRAATLLGSSDVTFDGNEFSNFRNGISFTEQDGLTVTDNEFYDMRTTFVNGATLHNATISDNHFSALDPWRSPHGGGDHGDYIHIWTRVTDDSPSDNILISGNFMETGISGTDSVLGIYIEDQGPGFTGVVIEDNLIHNSHPQGILMENTDGGIIRNNTLLQSSGEEANAPGILLTENTTNTLVENNVAARINGSSAEDTSLGNVFQGNLFVQSHSPDQPNFTGDMFLNPLTLDGETADFMVLPGSPAEGVGSSLTHYQTSDGTIAGIASESEGGLQMQTLQFSAEVLYGTGIDLSSAEVTWNFGDGGSATGANVSHSYLTPGTFETTATITQGSQTYHLAKTVVVNTPEIIEADFDTAIEDESFYDSPTVVEGNTKLVDTDLGKSLSMSADSTVEFGNEQGLYDNSEYSISMDISTPPNSGEDGMLVYFNGSAYAWFQDGELIFRGLTDQGEQFSLSTSNADLNDGNWHQVVYTFSEEAGSASLYIDGKVSDTVSGLQGKQITDIGQDFFLGNPFGDSFAGNVDNLSFVRAALDPTKIAEQYQALQAELAAGGGDSGQLGAVSTAAIDEDNDVPTEAEVQDLQAKLSAIKTQQGSPDPDDLDESVAQDPIFSFQVFFDKIMAILGDLFGFGGEEPIGGETTASGTAGVKQSGDETDLYKLVPATSESSETAGGDDSDEILDGEIAA